MSFRLTKVPDMRPPEWKHFYRTKGQFWRRLWWSNNVNLSSSKGPLCVRKNRDLNKLSGVESLVREAFVFVAPLCPPQLALSVSRVEELGAKESLFHV